MDFDALAETLRPHYSRFLGGLGDQILLTGHSHQAWPDVSREGHLAAWDDAARLIDKKWDRVFGEILPELQRHIATRLGSTRAADLAFAPNTHELVYRLSTCFDPTRAIVTTDSEFHSLDRQLRRLEERGTRVTRVEVENAPNTFAERFLEAVDREKPAWVALSMVTFTTSRVITQLPEILQVLASKDIPVLVDAYHAFNVLELEVDQWPGSVFVTAGGYKYAESGEGVCFMLVPRDAARYRPETTGWFSHFESLEIDRQQSQKVEYGTGGHRFFGATFDPTAFYRALYVYRFMESQSLTTRRLAAHSRAQTQMLIDAHRDLGLGTRGLELRTPPDDRGGFISLASKQSRQIWKRLDESGVHTDVRGDLLRLGPAPYLRSRDIESAMEVLDRVTRGLS